MNEYTILFTQNVFNFTFLLEILIVLIFVEVFIVNYLKT